MNTSTQLNQWLENDVETLDYSGRQMEQFKIDLREAVKQHLLDEFLESVCAFPYPDAYKVN